MQSSLPSIVFDGQFLVQLVAILRRQMVKKDNVAIVLVQWSNLPTENATWEDYTFPNLKRKVYYDPK